LRENNKLHKEKVMKQNQHELGNKLVVVAGGAGEIGERITRMFLQQGARVLVPSRSKEKLKALGASLKDISTGELIALETDVSNPQGLKTLSAAIGREGVLRAAVSSVGTFWQGPRSLEVPIDEVHRVFEETFFPYVGLTQALIPALGPDTHFVKLNGILSLQAVPNVSAFGVSATAQMAWTRFLIAEATESTPWITELVIDSLVRTRSSQTLPKEYISGDDIAHEILRIVTEENKHQIATIGKGPGDAEVEFVPLRSQASENNVKRLFGSFQARG
jgi:NADP-dependent 3-hydroxy acid dehydrogenase YdfG